MTPAAPVLDPALPGLEVATDAEAMRELLRRHLRPVAGAGWEVRACTISRLHYHRGDRCTVRYTLRIADGVSERGQWVTGLMYRGDRAERVWHKLRAEAPWRQEPGAFSTLEPAAFVPEARMLVQTFPFDRRLPALARLATPPVAELEDVLGGPFDDWRAEPVQYRPGRVAVLRHAVGPGGRRVYVKAYRHEGDVRRAQQVLEALQESATLAVPRPLGVLGGLRALVQEELPGRSLRQLLLADGDVAAAETAARALATAHREHVPGLPRHRLADELATLDRARRLLEWGLPELAPELRDVIRALAAGLDDAPPAPAHRELRSDHVLLDGARVGVVDLDSYAAADPLLDPARLLADLAGLGLEAAAAAFAEEYLRHAPSASRARLRLHYAGALLKEALDAFRHQEPRWPEQVAALLEEARSAVSGKAP